MTNYKLITIILLIVLIFGAGIVTARWNSNKHPSVSDVVNIDSDNLGEVVPVRFHDDGKNVTCWFDGESGLDTPVGFSCLPDYMLNRPSNYNPNTMP